jgi:hypothetical protein
MLIGTSSGAELWDAIFFSINLHNRSDSRGPSFVTLFLVTYLKQEIGMNGAIFYRDNRYLSPKTVHLASENYTLQE